MSLTPFFTSLVSLRSIEPIMTLGSLWPAKLLDLPILRSVYTQPLRVGQLIYGISRLLGAILDTCAFSISVFSDLVYSTLVSAAHSSYSPPPVYDPRY